MAVDDRRPDDPADSARRALRDLVLARGHLRLDEAVQLSSGAWSRDFIDAKRALARGDDLARACDALVSLVTGCGDGTGDGTGFDLVGGLTMGADMFAYGIALRSGRSWFVVRKQPKGRGTDRRIEGAAPGPGDRALLVEDVVTTGASMLDALGEVRATGATVVAAATLVDRGDEAAARFADAGVPYHPLLTYRELGIDPVVTPR